VDARGARQEARDEADATEQGEEPVVERHGAARSRPRPGRRARSRAPRRGARSARHRARRPCRPRDRPPTGRTSRRRAGDRRGPPSRRGTGARAGSRRLAAPTMTWLVGSAAGVVAGCPSPGRPCGRPPCSDGGDGPRRRAATICRPATRVQTTPCPSRGPAPAPVQREERPCGPTRPW
jgi:hypothetical protein